MRKQHKVFFVSKCCTVSNQIKKSTWKYLIRTMWTTSIKILLDLILHTLFICLFILTKLCFFACAEKTVIHFANTHIHNMILTYNIRVFFGKLNDAYFI